jgi:hypothetical protein
MSKPILDLLNAASWDYVWGATYQAAPAGNNGFIPIPAIDVPLLLQSSTLAIFCDSRTARPNWETAGTASRRIQSGLVVGGNFNLGVSGGVRLKLRQFTLVRFEQIAASYALSISPKFWLKDLEINVFTYNGIDSDSTTEQLNRIERSIDDLNLR